MWCLCGTGSGAVKSPTRLDRIPNLTETRVGYANFAPDTDLSEEKPKIQHLFWQVAVGPCASFAREPSQGRKAAALSGYEGVPQVAWPLLARADAEIGFHS